ncbi:MAG TPA: mechanosensitive ion channel domain-containing protein [Geobacteraceae bacterium]|nr:mechanosensitive ion channel domain-containing protein [Geobacteraceae bacterium]
MDRILDFYRLQPTDNLLMFWLKEILFALVIFAVFWLLAQLLKYVLVNWGPKFTSITKADLVDRIIRRITPPASIFVVFCGLYFAVRSLPLPDKAQEVSSGSIFVVNIIIFTNMAYRAIDEIIHWYGARVAERTGAAMDRQILPLAEKLITIFLVCSALIITLKHFSYDILSLVTALGIGSLAIGMAAKDTLANMISGFTLMIDRPFRIGDRIRLTSGLWGDVVDIGLRSTKIKTADNTLLIIPNSELCNSTLVNMAFPDLKSNGQINVRVAYGSDVVKVKELLVETALDLPEILRDPAPGAFFVSFGECSLNLSLSFWVDDYGKVFQVTDQLNTKIATRFAENGIEMPYPTRTVILEKEG